MADWTDFRRDIVWLVKLTLDQCDNTFGSAPCTATGTPCYYTYPTCKDRGNYVKSTYTWQFVNQAAPVIEGCKNLVRQNGDKVGVEFFETRIDPEKALTQVGKFRIRLADMDPLPWSCPGKNYDETEQNRESGDGTFWTNLKSRNGNYLYRTVEIYVGLRGWDLASYNLYFKGMLVDWEVHYGETELIIKDTLVNLKKKIPTRQSSENVLTGTISDSATSIAVTKDSNMMDPDNYGGECVAKIEDEYVSYTGLTTTSTTQTLTGCTRGAYGTTAAAHDAGTEVKNIAVVADDNSAASWADVNGMPADWCFLKLLVDFAGIGISDMVWSDSGGDYAGITGSGPYTIELDDAGGLPYKGAVKINSEVFYYTSRDDTYLYDADRAMFGTSSGSHSAGDDVYVAEFSEQSGTWLSTCLYKSAWERERPIKDALIELKQATGGRVWQGEDSRVHCRFAPGPFPTTDPVELTDGDNICNSPQIKVKDNESKNRKTRINVLYAPYKADPDEEEAGDWSSVVHYNTDIESDNYLGVSEPDTHYNKWIYRETEALLMASYRLIRYQYGAPDVEFALDLKDASQVDVGDFVRITTDRLVLTTGAPRQSVTCEVLSKKRLGDIKYKYLAEDITGGVEGARYAVIAPSSITHDYDSAGETEKNQYAWISDGNDQVGSNDDDGYQIL